MAITTQDVKRSTAKDERRLAVLIVSGDSWLTLLKDQGWQRFRVVGDALPDDAEFVAFAPCDVTGDPMSIRICVASSTFEPVPLNTVLPVLNPPVWEIARSVLSPNP